MATSTIKFEHPTSVEIGSITATDDNDFLKKLVDKFEVYPEDVPGLFHAKFSGHYQLYGFYENNSASVWFTASAGNRLYSVSKNRSTSVYSLYRQDMTAI